MAQHTRERWMEINGLCPVAGVPLGVTRSRSDKVRYVGQISLGSRRLSISHPFGRLSYIVAFPGNVLSH